MTQLIVAPKALQFEDKEVCCEQLKGFYNDRILARQFKTDDVNDVGVKSEIQQYRDKLDAKPLSFQRYQIYSAPFVQRDGKVTYQWLLKELGFHVNHLWQLSNCFFCFSFVFYFINGGMASFVPLMFNLGLSVNLISMQVRSQLALQSQIMMLSLVRFVSDGEAAESCDTIEMCTMDGKVRYVDVSAFSKVSEEHRKKDS